MMESPTDLNLFLNSYQTVYSLDKLADAASNIALRNFEWRFITFVFVNSTVLWGAEKFLRSYGQSVIVGRDVYVPNIARKTRQFVMFGSDITNIIHMLHGIQVHEYDNSGKFIIICQSQEPLLCDETEAMSVFWNNKIVDVVFLKIDKRYVAGYTYFPLQNNQCKTSVPTEIKFLEPCLENYYKCDNMFPEKLRNINKCQLIASSFIQMPFMYIDDGRPTGADGDLLQIIVEGLNASLKIMTPLRGSGWGQLESNGTWTGSLSDVLYEKANFSMTSAALTQARFSHFQLSKEYNTASVVWVTHSAELKPSSLKLLRPFHFETQIALIISFIVVILCAIFAKSKMWTSFIHRIRGSPSQDVVFYSWTICMGMPTTKLPSKSSFLFVVSIWIWYCVLVRTFYQVHLISALKGNYYYDEFQTTEDIIASKYPFGGGPALKDYYNDNPQIHDNWKDVQPPDIVPMLMKISMGEKFVLAMNMQTALTIVKKHKISIHIIPEKVVNSPTVIFFKRFSPLADHVNRILRWLTETGFSDKMYKNHASTNVVQKAPENQIPINVQHYTSCYAVLVLGWIISLVLLLVELYYCKIHK